MSTRFHVLLRPIRFQAVLLTLLVATLYPATVQSIEFSLPSLENKPLRLSDFRGRWVLVNFWATWCSPCLLEMPELQSFHETHRDRVTVIGINFQDLAASEVHDFINRLAVTFPIGLSQGQPIAGLELRALPTTFFISPTGKLIDKHEGTVNAAMLDARLEELQKTHQPTR